MLLEPGREDVTLDIVRLACRRLALPGRSWSVGRRVGRLDVRRRTRPGRRRHGRRAQVVGLEKLGFSSVRTPSHGRARPPNRLAASCRAIRTVPDRRSLTQSVNVQRLVFDCFYLLCLVLFRNMFGVCGDSTKVSIVCHDGDWKVRYDALG